MTTIQSTPSSTVRALLAAIDNRDLEAILALIAEDVHFHFGNGEPTDTKADYAAAAQAFLGAISGIRHELIDVWEVEDDNVVVTMNVHYKRLDGCELTLPCCNLFRVRGGLIHDYRIYMDVNPVFAP